MSNKCPSSRTQCNRGALRRIRLLSAQIATSSNLQEDARSLCEMIVKASAGKPRAWEVSLDQFRATGWRPLLLKLGHSNDIQCGCIKDLQAPGIAGVVPVRYYRPSCAKPDKKLPVCLYMHGGGWTQGDIEAYDGLCRALCNSGEFAVVSIEYRRAPESSMPAASDDCFAVLKWIFNDGLPGVDRDRIAVAGDSAGGHLAAVLAHLASRAGIRLQLQALLCPVTDARMGQESYASFADGHLLTRDMMAWFNKNYSGNDTNNWLASPLLAPHEEFKGLAPAFVLTASHDILRDEGYEYAEKLRSAGVPVEYKCQQGQIHVFFCFPKVINVAADALDHIATRIRQALG